MKSMIKLILVVCSLFILSPVYANTANSPVGYWKTIDDKTGKPKAIVQIWETPRLVLYGRILKIYPSPGYDQNELCTACSGSRHNQRIVGMVILNGFTQSQNNPQEWSGGEILDPKNGKTYHSYMETIDNGSRLNVRGYVGMPVFGRSQTWIRVSSPHGE